MYFFFVNLLKTKCKTYTTLIDLISIGRCTGMSCIKRTYHCQNIIIEKGKCRKRKVSHRYKFHATREFYLATLCIEFFCYLCYYAIGHAYAYALAILRREINWNNAECTLPFSPTRKVAEEFVNDRKATRSYLRTHMRFAFSARE